MLASNANIELLVAGSVFELNEASDNGGAALISDVDVGKVKVGWIKNNELIFGNTAVKSVMVFLILLLKRVTGLETTFPFSMGQGDEF